jgi:hypothetical protein
MSEEIKNITEQEIIDFIKSQPDDRAVDFADNLSHDKCGCVMVHYGRDILNLKDFACSFTNIGTFTHQGEEVPQASLEKNIREIVGLETWRRLPDTYGELKQLMGLN